MCGIAGVLRLAADDDRAKLPAQCERLAAELRHRGPDAAGFLGWSPNGDGIRVSERPHVTCGATVALVHTRLAIIDLSSGGAQPMVTPDRRFAIAYNGEIYNYIELRRELEAEGVRFVSTSDTEVLLAALSRWGVAAIPRLEGMFAFAFFDSGTRTVLLARDPFGIKPLFWHHDGSGIAFASELGSLLPLRKTSTLRANAPAVYRYLRYGITDDGEQSLIEGVRHFPPGTVVSIDLDRKTVSEPATYWSLDVDRPADLSFVEATRAVREQFLTSVERHLRSDVSVGACLSGGIDSSAVVGAMRAVSGSKLDLHTFSYVPDSGLLNEEPWVRTVADATGATVHLTQPGAPDLANDLDRLIRIQHEPFGSTSIYAQHRIFDLISRTGIKVVLDGQGADELLGGYSIFIGARIASLVRRGQPARAWRLANAARRQPGHERSHLQAGQFLIPQGLQSGFRALVGRGVAPRWLRRKWITFHEVDTDPIYRVSSGNLLEAQLKESLTLSLRSLLRYEDRNSMAFSIESRVPFLTPSFARLVLSLPEDYIIGNDGLTKRVFRAAMRGIVPDAVLDRRDKIAFQTPEHTWMRRVRPWCEGILSSDVARSIPVFDHSALMQEWNAGLADARRYHAWMWRWINLVRWTELLNVSYAPG